MSARSERAYGVAAGSSACSPRSPSSAAATFYVPGVTAAASRSGPRDRRAGHELGHHGHTHRSPRRCRTRQRAELEHGLAALAALGEPRGYRAPGWEFTQVTLALLAEHGFAYDSSLMADDRPYVVGAGTARVARHWTLDDAPYFAADPGPRPAAGVAAELDLAPGAAAVTLTLHPEILGRPHRVDLRRGVLDLATGLALRPVPTHAELAASIRRPPGAQGQA